MPTPATAQAKKSRQDGFFSVQEKSWIVRTEVNVPRKEFDREFRKMHLTTLELQRAWTFKGPLEFRAGGGVTYAGGFTAEPFSTPPDLRNRVNVTGFNAGVDLRWDLIRKAKYRVFLDGSIQALWTHGEQFPPSGTGVNGLVRGGPGVTVKINDRMAVETGYHLTHVSNGAGVVPHNPAYNGHGGYLALRWNR